MIVRTLSWGGRDPFMLEAQIGPYSFKNYDKKFIKTRQSPKHFLCSCSDSLQGHHLISIHERMGYWRPHLILTVTGEHASCEYGSLGLSSGFHDCG